MTDFKTTLLELAEPSEKTYASEDLKALESKSNFVLKSDAVEDLGGPEGSAVFLRVFRLLKPTLLCRNALRRRIIELFRAFSSFLRFKT